MSNKKIYLGNLSKATTETQIKDHFSGYGDIKEISLPLDKKTQAAKGYAFITFSQETDVEKALEQDGKELSGQNITVQIATERQSRK